MKPSFHERVWDLQQRKQGAERLKNRLEWERIGLKLQLNSTFGKLSVPIVTDFKFDPLFVRQQLRIRETRQLQREFRPF